MDDAPLFSCPHCKRAPIYMDSDSMLLAEPTYSLDNAHPEWEPDWIRQRFVVLFRCKDPKCGEIVAVSGETKYHERIKDESGGMLLRPHSMFPPPPIISLPDGLPPEVGKHLVLAFEFFWVDAGASANRLRISLENLLDDFKIPREREKAGKSYRLSLRERIAEFEEIDKEQAKTFDALRYVGNVGAHEDTVTDKSLLDAFYLYENALAQLYEKQKIESIRRKIIDTKGKY